VDQTVKENSMKRIAAAATLLLMAGVASAQRHRAPVISGTPEGQVAGRLEQEPDDAKKAALLEQFVAQNPKNEAVPWAYEQLIELYTKTRQPDKLLAAGDKLIALDPMDVEAAHQCLKGALELKRDPDMVLKWATTTSDIARKIAEPANAANESDSRLEFAKQVDVYAQYALYAMALQTTDPQKKIALGDTIEQRYPDSQYLAPLAEQRFLAYTQAGENDKAIAFAEKTLATDKSNAEMMLAMASAYVGKKEPDKALEMAAGAIEAMNAKPKPEGISDADWETRKTLVVGRAHWIQGVTYAAQQNWARTDQTLRAALPSLANSPDMKAEALFYLGLANYRLAEKGDIERVRDALNFSEQCAAIPGRFQGPARNNVRAIRSQYRIR
jgi:tetratricopeptide (TPR) repeat protein